MKRLHPKALLSTRRISDAPDRRGTAIIVVLVSIILIAILATTLIQITRFERIAGSESNIEAVVSATIAEILSQASSDILDNDGNAFNIYATATNGGGDEPYDFPYTRPNVYGNLRDADRLDGSTASGIIGGIMDDTWLASTAPDFRSSLPAGSAYSGTNTTNGMWRHLTDLTGMYVTNQSGGSNLSANNEPDELPITSQSIKMNIPADRADIANPILVDADGDGIGDSRWEWAPIREIAGVQYVMAVRIVDLSARMDLNVATGISVSNPAAAPRGDNPTEMDGINAVNLLAGEAGSGLTPGTVQSEWRNVQGFRLTGNTGSSVAGELNYDNNVDPASTPSRYHYWERGASRVGADFTRNGENGGSYDYRESSTFGLNDAFELLYRNGLNNATQTSVEQLMPTFLRDNGSSTTEDNFVTTGSTVTANNWNQQQFWELDARKMVSPYTGSMAISRPAIGISASEGEYKFNLNWDRSNDDYYDRIEPFLRSRWMDVASPSRSGSLRGQYPHLGNPAFLPDQLSVNIPDYIDRDNRITIGNNRAGFEALPYITEVYTQRPYTSGNVRPDPNDMNATDGIDQLVDWTPQGTPGYAIEIGNPFASRASGAWAGRPISLENIWLKIGNNAPVLISSLTTSTGGAAPTVLNPGEVLIIYNDSTGGNAMLDAVTDRWASSAGNLNIPTANVLEGPGLPTNTDNMTISLHAEEQSNAGTALSWYYCGAEITVGNTAIDDENVGPASGLMGGEVTYVQTNYQGIGDGLRMMTVHPQPKSANVRGFGDDISTYDAPSLNYDSATGQPGLDLDPSTSAPEFGQESKTNEPTGFTQLYGTDQQIVWFDNPRERMMWTGDLLQIPLIGPEYRTGGPNDKTMAQAIFRAAGSSTNLSNATLGDGVNALLLPYKSNAAKMNNDTGTNLGNAFGMYNMPHSLMLLEQVAAIQPATDLEDGDDDGFSEQSGNNPRPDYDEMLVAGRINLNTASRETLLRVLPFPDVPTRTAIADAIIARRESMTQEADHGIGADNVPGIAYVGSLYEQISDLPVNPSQIAGDTTNVSGVRVDHNDYEDTLGSYPSLQDGVIDDREEEIMFAKWLTEISDVRSDVFAAYIVVQGYRADDYTAGPVESARRIVIFSRGNVRSGERASALREFRIE